MKLRIRNLDRNDFMQYKCVAKNALGYSDGSITLYEVHPPTTTTTTESTTQIILPPSTRKPRRKGNRKRNRKRQRMERVNNNHDLENDMNNDAHENNNPTAILDKKEQEQ